MKYEMAGDVGQRNIPMISHAQLLSPAFCRALTMQNSAATADSKHFIVMARDTHKFHILIADDQGRFGQYSGPSILASLANYSIEDALTALETLQKLHEKPRDLLVLNLGMADQRGLELLRIVKATHLQTRILVACSFTDQWTARHILRSGAHGYLDQRLIDTDELPIAVTMVLSGKHYISDSLCQFLINGIDHSVGDQMATPFSSLERQLIGKTLMGCSVNTLAAELDLPEKVINSHQARVIRRMGLASSPA